MNFYIQHGEYRRNLYRPLLLALCCSTAFPLLAEPVMTVTAPQSDPGVIVTSTQTPRQPVPASDGADLLKTIPGFSILRSGGSNGDPVLRGMFGSRLNILADGASTQGGCGSRMDTPTAYIAPKNFDLLTVIKGPQTVLWGPMASAGTLLFERQPERFTEPQIKGNADVLHGANGRSDQNLNTTFGNTLGYVRVDGSRSVAGDYRDGKGNVVPSQWRKWSSGLTLGITPDDDSLIELSAGASNGQARYAGRAMDGSRFLRKNAAVRLEKTNLSEHFTKLSWQSYYNDTDHIMDNFSLRKPTGMKMSSQVGGVTYGSRLSGVWESDNTQLTSGIDAQRKTHRKKITGWQPDASIDQIGLFSEWRETISDNSTTVLGARLDRYQARDLRSSQKAERVALLPGGFARYEYTLPDAPVMLYSGIGYTERFPDYWELFAGKAGKQSFKRLRSEKTLQWDGGVQMRSEKLNLWASAYVGKVQDYILFNYTNTPSQAKNIDALIMGGEAGAGLALATHWTLDGSLNYAWGKNRTTGQPLPQMPPLEARLALNYQRDKLSTSLLWRVAASQQRIAIKQGNVTGQDFSTSPGFGVLSWNADYQLTPNFAARVGIDNLLNKNYSEHLNMAGNKQFGYAASQRIPEPGRTWWLGGTYNF